MASKRWNYPLFYKKKKQKWRENWKNIYIKKMLKHSWILNISTFCAAFTGKHSSVWTVAQAENVQIQTLCIFKENRVSNESSDSRCLLISSRWGEVAQEYKHNIPLCALLPHEGLNELRLSYFYHRWERTRTQFCNRMSNHEGYLSSVRLNFLYFQNKTTNLSLLVLLNSLCSLAASLLRIKLF